MSHKHVIPCSALFLFASWSTAVVAQPTERSPATSMSVRVPSSSVASALISSVKDLGRAGPTAQIEGARITFHRSATVDRALELRISQAHNPRSIHYRNWLSAQDIGAFYGPPAESVRKVEAWLRSKGLVINGLAPSRTSIEFSGSIADVEAAFGAEVHNISGRMQRREFASEPRVPLELADDIDGVVLSAPELLERPESSSTGTTSPKSPMIVPLLNWPYGDSYQFVSPQDFVAIYNVAPTWSAGIDGTGQTIALPAGSNVRTDDFNWFRGSFGLAATTLQTVHPGCGDPGMVLANIFEASIDAEWAGVAAPGASIQVASCPDTSSGQGALIALRNLINSSNPPQIISWSYATCESSLSEAQRNEINGMMQQAAAEGISVFVGAGDRGAGGSNCDAVNYKWIVNGIQLNAYAASPHVTAVGGTDFSDVYSGTTSQYWDVVNPPSPVNHYRSALSYIPEIPWNDSCASELAYQYYGSGFPSIQGFCASGFNAGEAYGGGGGASKFVPKPSWRKLPQ